MSLNKSKFYSSSEEEIYELIADEIENEKINIGLWTKAISNSKGDESKIKSLYIKYRFNKIQDNMPKKSFLENNRNFLLVMSVLLAFPIIFLLVITLFLG